MPRPIRYATDPQSLRREGLSETIAPWEDGLRAETGRGSFEWWYFDAHFEDGSTAVIVFLTKPLLERNGPLKPGVSLTITDPHGVKRVGFPLLPPEAFAASKETCDVHIGPHQARYIPSEGATWRYEVHVENVKDERGETLSADLTFTGLVPPWRPGAGKVYFGDREHYFAWLPAIPYGHVTGQVTYGGKQHAVRGTGYHDHNWGNVALGAVMDHWYWGRAHLGEYTVIFVEQVAARAYGFARIPVFMLAKGERILTGDGNPLRMSACDFVPHTGGHRYPRQVDFEWQGENGEVYLALRRPRLREAVSLLTTFPAWQRALLRLFGNPYYFRFEADLELKVDFEGTHAIESGTALYEIMLLQGRWHP
ncbi:MAG: hypothetical protein D6770_07385 [Anaerolineae bacterium]|nr:MAG: hypothetical protein D6770_07385 [Anaerolineae bacterium]